MPCQWCGSTDHESEQAGPKCQAAIEAARGSVVRKVAEMPAHNEGPSDRATDAAVEQANALAAYRIICERKEFRDLKIGESFLRASDVDKNPLDPPIWIKMNPLGPRPMCLDLRKQELQSIALVESVIRVRIAAITFEYLDVLEVEDVAKIILPERRKK